MPALVTYKQSASPVRRTSGDVNPTEIYEVSGVSSREEALAADGVPKDNDSHPIYPQAIVTSREAVGNLSLWRVTIQYAIPQAGTFILKNPDPLKQLPRVRIRVGLASIPTDVDANGVPLLSHFGRPFKTQPTVDRETTFIEIRRNERTFDYEFSRRVTGAINSADFRIAGILFPKYGLKCTGYVPEVEVDGTQPYIPTLLTFEAVQPEELDPHPYQLTLAETSSEGAGRLNGKVVIGPLVTYSGTNGADGSIVSLDQLQPAADVPIQENGLPIAGEPYDNLWVRIGNVILKPIPISRKGGQPIFVRSAASGQLVSVYQTKKMLDFNRFVS